MLVVPGLGASYPFRIDEGVAAAFARTYELGIYHQRCGTDNSLPYTRFVHPACHLSAAVIPLDWNAIGYAAQVGPGTFQFTDLTAATFPTGSIG